MWGEKGMWGRVEGGAGKMPRTGAAVCNFTLSVAGAQGSDLRLAN